MGPPAVELMEDLVVVTVDRVVGVVVVVVTTKVRDEVLVVEVEVRCKQHLFINTNTNSCHPLKVHTTHNVTQE